MVSRWCDASPLSIKSRVTWNTWAVQGRNIYNLELIYSLKWWEVGAAHWLKIKCLRVGLFRLLEFLMLVGLINVLCGGSAQFHFLSERSLALALAFSFSINVCLHCVSVVSCDCLSCDSVCSAGGNTGIGKATALHLARKGARVILACRNRDKAQAAITDIEQVELGRAWRRFRRNIRADSCQN